MKILKYYNESWKFIASSKRYILWASLIFILFALIGFIFPIFFKNEIIQFIQQITLKISSMNAKQIIPFIILNNAKASLFAILLGVIFGIFPLITLVTNGYLLGFVARHAVSQDGIFILWKLFPHGIFELPAVILSISLGFRLGIDLFKNKNNFSREFILSLKAFLLVILPLLIIAGIIEGTLILILK